MVMRRGTVLMLMVCMGAGTFTVDGKVTRTTDECFETYLNTTLHEDITCKEKFILAYCVARDRGYFIKNLTDSNIHELDLTLRQKLNLSKSSCHLDLRSVINGFHLDQSNVTENWLVQLNQTQSTKQTTATPAERSSVRTSKLSTPKRPVTRRPTGRREKGRFQEIQHASVSTKGQVTERFIKKPTTRRTHARYFTGRFRKRLTTQKLPTRHTTERPRRRPISERSTSTIMKSAVRTSTKRSPIGTTAHRLATMPIKQRTPKMSAMQRASKKTVTRKTPATNRPTHKPTTSKIKTCIQVPNIMCGSSRRGNYAVCYPDCQSGVYLNCNQGRSTLRYCPTTTFSVQGKVYEVTKMFDPVDEKCKITTQFCPQDLEKFQRGVM